MVQELGESTQQMIKDDQEHVEKLLNANPKGRYWIVIAYKPSRMFMPTGEPIIKRFIKAYSVKPKPLMGTIVHEVVDGEIRDTQVNMHDAPIDWERISSYLGFSEDPLVQKRSDIGKAYIYNK